MAVVNQDAEFEAMLAELDAMMRPPPPGGSGMEPVAVPGVTDTANALLQPRPGQGGPSLRSTSTPFGETVAGALGPVAGSYASGIDKTLQASRPFAREFTGLPAMDRGGGNLIEGLRQSDPMRVAGGAVEAAAGALPYAGATRVANALFRTVPRGMASGAAIGAAPLAGDGALSPTPAQAQTVVTEADINNKLRSMSQDQLRAYQAQIGLPETDQDGRIGPQTRAAALAYETRQAAQNDVAAKAKLEQARIEAQGRAQAEQERARIEAQAAAERAKAQQALELEGQRRTTAKKTPLRDLYPEVMPWLPVATGALTGGLGGRIQAAYSQPFKRQLESLSERWLNAISTGNKTLAGEYQTQFNALLRKGQGGLAPSVINPGLLGAELSVLPEEIDIMRGVPGSYDRFLAGDTLKRAGMGAAMGAASGAVGSKLSRAQYSGYTPDYNAATNALARTPPPYRGPVAGPQPQLPPPGARALPVRDPVTGRMVRADSPRGRQILSGNP